MGCKFRLPASGLAQASNSMHPRVKKFRKAVQEGLGAKEIQTYQENIENEVTVLLSQLFKNPSATSEGFARYVSPMHLPRINPLADRIQKDECIYHHQYCIWFTHTARNPPSPDPKHKQGRLNTG